MTEPAKPTFKVETIDDLRRILIAAQGGDPEAQQTLNSFLKFNNNIERSNLPTRRDVVAIAYLDACGKLYYPDDKDNPFAVVQDCLAVAFMAKGGDKSKQFVELMKQTPNMVDMQTIGMPQQRSLTDRLFRRKEPES